MKRKRITSRNKTGVTHESFTMSELAERVSELPEYFETRSDWNARISDTTGECEWFGNMSLVDSVDAMVNGWSDAPSVDTMTLPETATHSDSQQYFNDVSGSILDIAAFTAGDPECWLYEAPETIVHGRLINISIEVGGSFMVQARELMARANAIVALVHSLELSGHAIHLTVTRGYRVTGGDGTLYSYDFLVKDYGDALNINRLQFMLSPAFFRRCLFAMQEHFHEANISSSTDSYRPANSDIHLTHAIGLCEDLNTAMNEVRAAALSLFL